MAVQGDGAVEDVEVVVAADRKCAVPRQQTLILLRYLLFTVNM